MKLLKEERQYKRMSIIRGLSCLQLIWRRRGDEENNRKANIVCIRGTLAGNIVYYC